MEKHVTISQDTHAKLVRLKALMGVSHKGIVSLLIARELAAQTKKSRR